MDTLPTAFGKISRKPPPETPQGAQPSRGAPAGRGPRGNFGSRGGRGRGGFLAPPLPNVMNEGVKRPHPNSAQSHQAMPSQRGRGGGGFQYRGGGRGGHHGAGHNAGGSSHGLFKMSMCEDPWREIFEQRARAKGQTQQ